MDPPTALAGTTQISVHCGECNCTLTKWISQVKTVDSSVKSFREDLLALNLTYDRLAASLKDAAMIQAARSTDDYAGGQLWSSISVTLTNCQRTILETRQVLQHIEYGRRRMSSIIKGLLEALKSGELVIIRDAVKLFDMNIAFPVAMINITIQLQQSILSESAQEKITQDLAELKKEHDGFASKVQKLATDPRCAENRIFSQMQAFTGSIKVFLDNSARALHNASPQRDRDLDLNMNPPDQVLIQVPYQEQAAWVETPQTYAAPVQQYHEVFEDTGSATNSSLRARETQSLVETTMDDEDNEIELELTLEYMANGQADLEAEDFEGAEENFRLAMEMTTENDLSKHLDYGPGDITLMLADCLMKQEKEEEALELLEPLADGATPFSKNDDAASLTGSLRPTGEMVLQFEACHIMGMVFFKREDYQAAENRAKDAFKGRRRLLGATDQSTLQSVQLIIDIYAAKNDQVNARAYRRFLQPNSRNKSSIGSAASMTTSMEARPDGARSPQSMDGAMPSVTRKHHTTRLSEAGLPTRSATVIHSSIMTPAPLQTRKPSQLTSQPPNPSMRAGVQQPTQPEFNTIPPKNPARATRSPEPECSKASIEEHVETNIQHRPMSNQDQTPTSVASPVIDANSTKDNLPARSMTDLKPADIVNSPVSKIEPDPLPENISTATSTSGTKKKMSWLFSKSNKSETSNDKDSQHSGDASRTSSMTATNLANAKRHMSLAGSFNFESRNILAKFSDYGDDKEVKSGIGARSYSTSTHPSRTRQELGPKFNAIKQLRAAGKKGPAVDTAMKLLKEYDLDRKVILVREDELKKNMRESHKALAGTGYGYAPIHFFCERKHEANIEVELLIEQGVDVNAVAYRAGMPGTDPFTPLQRATELGHAEIVRLLIEADVSFDPPKPPKVTSALASKEQLTQPLLIACTKGHTQVTYILLAAGAGKTLKDFPQRLWHGNSLLHEACWHANPEMVKMLLDYSHKLRQSTTSTNQPDYESGIIGSPHQQDQFGATPIMYAIDLRDCTSDKMRRAKTLNRKHCLQLLLDHPGAARLQQSPTNSSANATSQAYRQSVADTLSLKWHKGPGAGHSIFCYADEAADDDLTRLLEPFKYQVSPGTRCAATPQCSATLRSKVLRSSSANHNNSSNSSSGNTGGGFSGDGGIEGRTMRMPNFPELMSAPVPAEFSDRSDAPPPSFESAVASPRSPTFGFGGGAGVDGREGTGGGVWRGGGTTVRSGTSGASGGSGSMYSDRGL